MLWFDEKQPLRIYHDEDSLKLAVQVARNSNWSIILTPDDLRRIGQTWLTSMLNLNSEITRQYNISKSELEGWED